MKELQENLYLNTTILEVIIPKLKITCVFRRKKTRINQIPADTLAVKDEATARQSPMPLKLTFIPLINVNCVRLRDS